MKAATKSEISKETMEARRKVEENSAKRKKEEQEKIDRENMIWEAKKELLGV